jgi:2'-5' RNA ligase
MRKNLYLIEFRFFGKTKQEIKSLIWDINKKYHIRPKRRPVPHISLVGPFTTNNEKEVIRRFQSICQNQDIMEFEVIGFDTFEDNRVVFIDIKPDAKLDEFRWELSRNLQPFCKLTQFDIYRKFEYHSTIAMKLNPRKFAYVKQYINKLSTRHFRNVLLRVTLIKNSRILYEYDFLLRKLLNRREAKSKKILSYTFTELKDHLEKRSKHLSTR